MRLWDSGLVPRHDEIEVSSLGATSGRITDGGIEAPSNIVSVRWRYYPMAATGLPEWR